MGQYWPCDPNIDIIQLSNFGLKRRDLSEHQHKGSIVPRQVTWRGDSFESYRVSLTSFVSSISEVGKRVGANPTGKSSLPSSQDGLRHPLRAVMLYADFVQFSNRGHIASAWCSCRTCSKKKTWASTQARGSVGRLGEVAGGSGSALPRSFESMAVWHFEL
jgi:hypothetical protein